MDNLDEKAIINRMLSGYCSHFIAWGAMKYFEMYQAGEMLFQKRTAASGWRLTSQTTPP